jgi:hypothetical protein
MTQLSAQAQQIIRDYHTLPFENHSVTTPYFNNQLSKVRGGLRALIGKGTPEDIVEEAKIIAVRDRIDFSKVSDAEIKKFLVDHNLGVDCSAFAYYILNAECEAQGHGTLPTKLFFPHAKSLMRKIITKFRPVENCDVVTLAHERNSREVSLSEVQPGDMIILWRTGIEHTLNHVLIVTEVNGKKISYVHTFRWSKEGQYEHGVRTGTIIITDPKKNLSEQIWEEKNTTGTENETMQHVKMAEITEMRRLKILK